MKSDLEKFLDSFTSVASDASSDFIDASQFESVILSSSEFLSINISDGASITAQEFTDALRARAVLVDGLRSAEGTEAPAPNQDPPPQELAPIITQILNGSVHLTNGSPIESDATLKIFSDTIYNEIEILADIAKGQNRHLARILDHCKDALQLPISERAVITLGFYQRNLKVHQPAVTEEFDSFFLGNYKSLIQNIEIYLSQFETWRNFMFAVELSEVNSATPKDVETAIALSKKLSEKIIVIDAQVRDALNLLSASITDSTKRTAELIHGFYQSLANVLSSLVEISNSDIMRNTSDFVAELDREIAKNAAPMIAKALVGTAIYEFAAFFMKFPSLFGFMVP